MRLSATQLAGVLDEVADTARRLQRSGPQLVVRSRRDSGVGYPSSTSGGGRIGGSRGTHGDPVQAAALRLVEHGDRDPVAGAAADVEAEIMTAVAALRRAESAVMQVTPPAATPGGCRLCATVGVWTPVHRVQLCRADYEYERRHGCDTPEQVLRTRAARQRGELRRSA